MKSLPPMTDRLHFVLDKANEIRSRKGDKYLAPEHVLVAIAEERFNVGAVALQNLCGDNAMEVVRREVASLRGWTGTGGGGQPPTPAPTPASTLTAEELNFLDTLSLDLRRQGLDRDADELHTLRDRLLAAGNKS